MTSWPSPSTPPWPGGRVPPGLAGQDTPVADVKVNGGAPDALVLKPAPDGPVGVSKDGILTGRSDEAS